MRVAYLRQGPIGFETSFGWEHNRIGLASGMIEAGVSEFAFFNCNEDAGWKKRWGAWKPELLAPVTLINDWTKQKKYLAKTDLLIVEQAERALPRFWCPPTGGSSVTPENIDMTWLFRFWITLGMYEGPVLLIYNDPKCRAQLLPESIALRYLEGKPIAHWTSNNKSLTVITEANNTERLVAEDSAWRDNTDMSAAGFGIQAFSANLSTIFFPRGMRHRMGNKYGVPLSPRKEWLAREWDAVYFGKPKNQRPRELLKMCQGQRVLCIGNGWEEVKAHLLKKVGASLNWTCMPTVKSRLDLERLIATAKFCACPGDDFYYRYHSLTARPFEGITQGAVPIIADDFHAADITGDKFPKVETRFPSSLLAGTSLSYDKTVDDMAQVLSWESRSKALAERVLAIATATRSGKAGHRGSLSAAYARYLNYRFSEAKLKSYPMDKADVARAYKHGEIYGAC